MTENQVTDVEIDVNEQIQQRQEKLKVLREKGNAYPNHFSLIVMANILMSNSREHPLQLWLPVVL